MNRQADRGPETGQQPDGRKEQLRERTKRAFEEDKALDAAVRRSIEVHGA